MWTKNSSWTLLVERGAWETLCSGQDMIRSPPWTASFNMRMENFSLLERLFINHNKSLYQIVGLESIGGRARWMSWLCMLSLLSVARVPIRQAVLQVWSRVAISRVYDSKISSFWCSSSCHLNKSTIRSLVFQTSNGLQLFLTALVSLFRTWTSS